MDAKSAKSPLDPQTDLANTHCEDRPANRIEYLSMSMRCSISREVPKRRKESSSVTQDNVIPSHSLPRPSVPTYFVHRLDRFRQGRQPVYWQAKSASDAAEEIPFETSVGPVRIWCDEQMKGSAKLRYVTSDSNPVDLFT